MTILKIQVINIAEYVNQNITKEEYSKQIINENEYSKQRIKIEDSHA